MFNFDRAGEKIQNIAKILFFICVVGCIIGAIICFCYYSDAVNEYNYYKSNIKSTYGNYDSSVSLSKSLLWCGLLLLTVGPLVSYVYSLLLYGFGRLIENSEITADCSDMIYKNTNEIISPTVIVPKKNQIKHTKKHKKNNSQENSKRNNK